jgi:Flp pilus assembly protein TadD/glutathione synthase/RimK-type ligase-like ATP-grasp enzyme
MQETGWQEALGGAELESGIPAEIKIGTVHGKAAGAGIEVGTGREVGTEIAAGAGAGIGAGIKDAAGIGLTAGAGSAVPAPGKAAGQLLAAQRPQMLELALQLAQARAQVDPASTDLLFEQGYLLEQLGRVTEARSFYGRVLERVPTHLGALTQLAGLLLAGDALAEAGALYLRTVQAHPNDIATRVSLGNLLFKANQVAAAREQFEAALRIDPAYRAAHAGLAYVMDQLGDMERAALYRSKAFSGQCMVNLPYRGPKQPIHVLLLMATTTGNVPTHRFLTNQIFERILVATEFYEPGLPLPPHHLVFNAVGEADTSAAALAGAAAVLANTKAPVINPPSAVLATSRQAVAERLAAVPGVVTAKTLLLKRERLLQSDAATVLAEQGLRFPLLLRTPGFHGGQHFVRVEAMAGLVEAVGSLPGDELLVIEYLDARGADGQSRKYRVMLIDGKLYPLHLAISQDWKIHYFSADMAESPENRAADEAFITDMPKVLGAAAVGALERVQEILGLDFGGIDFGLNDRGEILIFEANSTMSVVVPDPDPRWDYRRPAVRRIYEAVLRMLVDRAVRGGGFRG